MKTEEQTPNTIVRHSNHNYQVFLRDQCAFSAMQSIINSSNYDNFLGNNGMPVPEFVAKESYLIADAMLKQREL